MRPTLAVTAPNTAGLLPEDKPLFLTCGSNRLTRPPAAAPEA